MQYIQEAKEEPDDAGCVFCSIPQTEPERVLVLGDLAYVVLNKFPYNPGHLLVVPLRHVGDLEAVTTEENGELQALLQRSLAAIRRTSDPAGFNVGLNLGRIAGAGSRGTCTGTWSRDGAVTRTSCRSWDRHACFPSCSRRRTSD